MTNNTEGPEGLRKAAERLLSYVNRTKWTFSPNDMRPVSEAVLASLPAEGGEAVETLARELAEERWQVDEELHGVCGTTAYDGKLEDFLPDARAFVMRCAALSATPTPQGASVVVPRESLDDAARRLFDKQYPGRSYDDLKDLTKISWLRAAHDELIAAAPAPSPSEGDDDLSEAVRLLSRIVRVYGDMQDGSGNTPTEIRKAKRFVARLSRTEAATGRSDPSGGAS